MLITHRQKQRQLRLKLRHKLSQPLRTTRWRNGYGRRWWLALLVTLAVCLAGPVAQAQEALWEQHLAPNELVPNRLAPSTTGKVSVERAIRIVRRETGGRVLAAEAGTSQGRPGVNVRTLLDGERVTTFFVFADGHIQKR